MGRSMTSDQVQTSLLHGTSTAKLGFVGIRPVKVTSEAGVAD